MDFQKSEDAMDETDRQVLACLQEDATIPVAEIGKQIARRLAVPLSRGHERKHGQQARSLIQCIGLPHDRVGNCRVRHECVHIEAMLEIAVHLDTALTGGESSKG